ncbi:hypothetical protein ACLOJK_011992 [Asimina triloba]
MTEAKTKHTVCYLNADSWETDERPMEVSVQLKNHAIYRLNAAIGKDLKIANAVNEGKLVPEDIIFGLLSKRLEEGYHRGETGFILDGLPRTQIQAVSMRYSHCQTDVVVGPSDVVKKQEILDQIADIDLVVNFKCNKDCLLKKHLGSGICACCGKSSNMSSPESASLPLCSTKLAQHTQLNSCAVAEDAWNEKLRIYAEQSKPLEDYYRKQRKLLDFHVASGPGETWRGLLSALHLQHADALNSSSSHKLSA